MKPLIRPVVVAVALLVATVGADAKPKLGIETWTCREMTFDQTVEFAAAHGIKLLEVTSRHIDRNDPLEVNLKKKAFLDAHGITAYTMGVCATSMDQASNRKLFELAKLFGMKVLVVEPKDPAEWDLLEALVKEYDIKLAIHNHGTGTVYGNPANVKAVLAKRDKRIGVCMDIGWLTAAGFDAAAIFENYGDRVYDMHLKDKRVDSVDGKTTATDTFIGLGNTNYAGLVAAMKKAKWSGVMSLETDSADFAKDPSGFVDSGKKFFDAAFGD